MYIFSNLSPSKDRHGGKNSFVKILDLKLRKLFDVDFSKAREEQKPSSHRLNYSLATYKHKSYLYGGLDSSSKILSTLDEFDATTYKFTAVKLRGDLKPRGRQAHCALITDQYTMFILGGTYQTCLIDPAPIQDEQVLTYDLEASTFHPLSTTGDKPSNLIFPSAFLLNNNSIGVIWYENVQIS
jgi:hypothetical protein